MYTTIVKLFWGERVGEGLSDQMELLSTGQKPDLDDRAGSASTVNDAM